MRGIEEAHAIHELVWINEQSVDRVPGQAKRGQHSKHHGCVAAIFRVRDDVPAELRNGVFASPREYPAWVRFSNGRQRDDRHADAHGMAIKLLDVVGPKLIEGHEQELAQDFVLVDHETFFTGDPSLYALVNQATLGRHGLLVRLALWTRLILCHPFLVLRMRAFIANRPTSPLGCAYFSTTPYRLNQHRVKYVTKPRTICENLPLQSADGLADALATTLERKAMVFDFGVDVQTDADAQPIEDPTICWSELDGARREWLAELIIPRQAVNRAAPLAENLAFSPWHALKAHEPLGYINRARLPVYRAMARQRHTLNGIVPEESSEAPASYAAAPSEGSGAGPPIAGGRGAPLGRRGMTPGRLLVTLLLLGACAYGEYDWLYDWLTTPSWLLTVKMCRSGSYGRSADAIAELLRRFL